MRGVRSLACLTLLGLFLALPATAPAAGNRFSGHTAQGFSLRARLAGKQIFLVRVKVKLRCRDGGLLYDDLSDFEASRLRRGGRFADVQFGPSDEVHWQGRVNGARLHGNLRVKDRLGNGVRCDSGTVRFTIRRQGS